MKRRSHARRVDANQAEIIAALETIGCYVWRLETPVDLLVGRAGRTYLLEVKNPDGFDTITDKQKAFIAEWRGAPVHIVRSVEEACRVVTVEQLPFG